MQRPLIKLLILLAVAGLLVFLALNFVFTKSDAPSGKIMLSSSTVEIQGQSVSLCLDERISTPDDGYIDFTRAPSVAINEFEGFAREYSKYFLPEPTNSQSNGSQISAAKKCNSVDRDGLTHYVMGSGTGQQRAKYHVYADGDSIVHIDGFFLDSES